MSGTDNTPTQLQEVLKEVIIEARDHAAKEAESADEKEAIFHHHYMGAIGWAKKWHQESTKLQELLAEHAGLRDEVISLRNWKQETMRLLMPILDWGDAAMVPLGKSVTRECLERAKAYDALKEKAEALATAMNDIATGKALPQLIAQQALSAWSGKGVIG